MTIIHSTVTLEHKSLLPRDRVTNTFTFRGPSPLDFAMLVPIQAALENFYNTPGPGATISIGTLISGCMSRTIKPIIRHYDVTAHLAGDPAGSPISESEFSAVLDTNGVSDNEPSEIAIALSFAADFGVDVEFAPGARPRARDRGRVYVGPITSQAKDFTAVQAPIVSPSGLTTVSKAGRALIDDPNTEWVVWSRTAAAVKPVTSCWVDNAFDVVRRRGEAATARTLG